MHSSRAHQLAPPATASHSCLRPFAPIPFPLGPASPQLLPCRSPLRIPTSRHSFAAANKPCLVLSLASRANRQHGSHPVDNLNAINLPAESTLKVSAEAGEERRRARDRRAMSYGTGSGGANAGPTGGTRSAFGVLPERVRNDEIAPFEASQRSSRCDALLSRAAASICSAS